MPVVAALDRSSQIGSGGEVGGYELRVDAQHLADHPPAVVVVLRLAVLDLHAELAERVDDRPGEAHERAGEVLLADRHAVDRAVPVPAGIDQVTDRSVQQAHLLDLPYPATAVSERPGRGHRQEELGGRAGSAVGIAVEPL